MPVTVAAAAAISVLLFVFLGVFAWTCGRADVSPCAREDCKRARVAAVVICAALVAIVVGNAVFMAFHRAAHGSVKGMG
jgi:protein-S-isoprenylcysteine O-methyltransferase Ste14